MTSKLKCPFCQQELREIYFNGVGVGYICPNPYCKKAEKLKGNTEFWQELIRTRKALDVAVDVLKEIDWCAQDYAKAQEVLTKITALTKGSDNE